MKKLARFFVGVKKELKKVRWPKKKEMVVYSVATICIIAFFMGFFFGIDTVISIIKKG